MTVFFSTNDDGAWYEQFLFRLSNSLARVRMFLMSDKEERCLVSTPSPSRIYVAEREEGKEKASAVDDDSV